MNAAVEGAAADESLADPLRRIAERVARNVARREAAQRAAADPEYYKRCPRGIKMLADHLRWGGEL